MPHSVDLINLVDRIQGIVTSTLNSKISWFKKLMLIIEILVKEIEDISNNSDKFGKFTGVEKKSLVVELVVDLYLRKFDSKYIPNVIEKFIVEKLTSFMIDKIVHGFNKSGIFKHS